MAGTELKQSKDAPLSFFSFQDIIASVTALMVLITLVIALDPIGDEITLRKRAAAEPMTQQGRAEQARIRLESANAAIAQARQALQERQSQPNVTADLVARMDRLVAPERDGVAALEQVASAGDAELRAVEDRLLVAQAQTKETEREIERRREAEADRIMRSRVRAFEGPAEPLKPLMIEVRPDGAVIGTLDERRMPVEMTMCSGTPQQQIECIAKLLAAHPRTEWYGLFVVWPDGLGRFRELRAAFMGRGYEVGWQLWDSAGGGFFERPEVEVPNPDQQAPPTEGAKRFDPQQPAGADARAHAERVSESCPHEGATGAPPSGPWPLAVPASVAMLARVHRRGRKGGSIGTDPFGLFLDALCNTLGVVMLLLMVILIFSKADGAQPDPKAAEAKAVELERTALDAERELQGLLESLSKLPPGGDPALVARWNALLAEGERLRTRRAALQQSVSDIRQALEARRRELEDADARKRVVDAQAAALAAKQSSTPDFIRLSRFRPDSRASVKLGVAFGHVSAIEVNPMIGAEAPAQGMPLASDADAAAAIAALIGQRMPGEIRLEVAVWADSFGAYKRLERALVERGYAINPIPIEVGNRVGVVSGQGGVQ